MYSCTRGLLSRGSIVKKDMNRRRGLAEKCLALHSDPTLETIRSIEVAHARTQDAGPMVGMAFLRSHHGAGSRLPLVADVQPVIMQE
jgi:hypothetical protein